VQSTNFYRSNAKPACFQKDTYATRRHPLSQAAHDPTSHQHVLHLCFGSFSLSLSLSPSNPTQQPSDVLRQKREQMDTILYSLPPLSRSQYTAVAKRVSRYIEKRREGGYSESDDGVEEQIYMDCTNPVYDGTVYTIEYISRFH
jgi:hypothetical protein